ncbi:MAG: hypothetical protein ACXVZR_12745 [Terriglobales bacterium]
MNKTALGADNASSGNSDFNRGFHVGRSCFTLNRGYQGNQVFDIAVAVRKWILQNQDKAADRLPGKPLEGPEPRGQSRAF